MSQEKISWLALEPTMAAGSSPRPSGKSTLPAKLDSQAKTATAPTSSGISQPLLSRPCKPAITRKLRGTSSAAITSNPRLVDSSFQCRRVYQPAPKRDVVMKAKITNGANGIFSSFPVVQRLITNAMEQPTMSRPPNSSPQKILRCSMKLASTSRRERRGGRGGGGGGGGTVSGAAGTAVWLS